MTATNSIWSGIEMLAATDGETSGELDWDASGVSIDTRTIGSGDVFVALKDARDGHDFVPSANENGAVAALVSREVDVGDNGLCQIRVRDPYDALVRLGAAARDRCFGKMIGVTGSAGKTSTKEMLRSALSRQGNVHAAIKSFNNHLGVPLTLAAMTSSTDYGVFEIGMNHAGEITPLTKLVKPHVAIITTVAAAHLEFLGSMDAIAAAKAEIFQGVRPGGAVVLPADNPYYEFLVGEATSLGIGTIVPFGSAEEAGKGVRLLKTSQGSAGTVKVECSVFGELKEFELAVQGNHHVSNALAVVAASQLVGAELSGVFAGLASFAPGAGRGAAHKISIDGHAITVLDESYNANPASMEASFQVLRSEQVQGTGRRIAVLGEMKELGPQSGQLHAGLAGPLLRAGVDLVFTAGDDMTHLRSALPPDVAGAHADEALGLLDALVATVNSGDVVLFKGSNASKVGALVSALLAKAKGAV